MGETREERLERRARKNLVYNLRCQDGKRSKARYQKWEEQRWLRRLKADGSQNPGKQSDYEIGKRSGLKAGTSREVRLKIAALEGGFWVPDTDRQMPGWLAKWHPVKNMPESIKPESIRPALNSRADKATTKTSAGDWLKKKMGFEEAARHSADFAARFDD